MSCMVCRKSDVRLFSVSKNYGTINHTVGDDLIEIYGDKVSLHLTPDSVVCNVCMNILDNMAMLLRNIWSIITNPLEQPQSGHVVKLLKFFASIKIEEDLKDDLESSRTKTLTPSKLLRHTYSVPYRSNEEDHIAEQERQRSMSRGSSISNTSEVKNIFTGRRRKKGHNWTRVKRGRPKSVDSGSVSRPTSDCSIRSTRSSRRSPARKKQIVEYDDQGRLTKKRTRSVSRAQEEVEKLREQVEEGKYYCLEKDCTLYFKDLDVLNLHKIIDHELLALHYCEECQQRYTTSQHLNLHSKIHDISSFFCLICGCELENRSALQSHLDEHLVYSVPCKYCDREFLSKHLCEQHLKTAHRGKRKRRIYKDKLIIDRFDSGSSEKENNFRKKRDYRVEYMYQTDIEYESDDMDVTVENMKLRNIEFHIVDSEFRSTDSPDLTSADESGLDADITDLRLTGDLDLKKIGNPELRLADSPDLSPVGNSDLEKANSPEMSFAVDSDLRPADDSFPRLVEDSDLGPSDDSELITNYSSNPT